MAGMMPVGGFLRFWKAGEAVFCRRGHGVDVPAFEIAHNPRTTPRSGPREGFHGMARCEGEGQARHPSDKHPRTPHSLFKFPCS